MWSARFQSHMNHVSVSPTDGNGPHSRTEKNSDQGGNWTHDLRVRSPPLYRLSYKVRREQAVGTESHGNEYEQVHGKVYVYVIFGYLINGMISYLIGCLINGLISYLMGCWINGMIFCHFKIRLNFKSWFLLDFLEINLFTTYQFRKVFVLRKQHFEFPNCHLRDTR